MARLPWTLGPVAHRGLHNPAKGIVENTVSSIEAAIAKGYHVEIDVQAAKGGVPVLFHDETLDRLMEGRGNVADLTAPELKRLAYKGSRDRIVTLDEVLEVIGRRQPLYVEVKTAFGVPGELERQIAGSLERYQGPVAAMSFDPWSLLAIRAAAPRIPRGIISYRWDDDWMPQLSRYQRSKLRMLAYSPSVRPSFIAYDIDDLPHFPPLLAKRMLGLPLLTWTVRTPQQQAIAAKYADAIIFEGFEP